MPDSVLTLYKERPADGYVDLESAEKMDDGEWMVDGGGLGVFIEAIKGTVLLIDLCFNNQGDGFLDRLMSFFQALYTS